MSRGRHEGDRRTPSTRWPAIVRATARWLMRAAWEMIQQLVEGDGSNLFFKEIGTVRNEGSRTVAQSGETSAVRELPSPGYIKVTACSPGVNPFQLDTDSRAEPVQGFLTTE